MINKIGNSGVAFKMNIRNKDMDSKEFKYQSEQIKNNPYLAILDDKYNVDVTLGQNRMSVDCFEKPTGKTEKFLEKIFGPARRVFSTTERRCDRSYLEGTDGYWSRKKSALPGMAAHAVFKDYDKTKDNEVWCWNGYSATLPGDISEGLSKYGEKLYYMDKESKNFVAKNEILSKMERVGDTLSDISSMHYKQKDARYEAEYQKRVEKGNADKIEKGETCNPSEHSLPPGGCF